MAWSGLLGVVWVAGGPGQMGQWAWPGGIMGVARRDCGRGQQGLWVWLGSGGVGGEWA